MIDVLLSLFVNACWGTIVVEMAIYPPPYLFMVWGIVGGTLCLWVDQRATQRRIEAESLRLQRIEQSKVAIWKDLPLKGICR